MNANTPEELELEIGTQLKGLRLNQNLTQATLAARAGCGLSAVKNLESGKGATLKTLVSVTRALGRESWLHSVAPTATISPLNMPKSGPNRQRARAATKKKG